MKDGSLVHIDSVVSGLACGCVCPLCSSPLLARKGKRNIHHFSHKGDSNCNPETVLHWLGKQLLFNRIKKSIDSQTELIFEWKCSHCYDAHKGNLTKKATAVLLEQSLGPIRPDIALMDSSGRPLIVIEVIVSHHPELETIDYCDKNKIYLLQVNLKSEKDLYGIEDEILKLNCSLDYCPERKKCPLCGDFCYKKYVQTTYIECWKCKRQMKLATFYSLDWYGARCFSEKDCTVARELGAIVKKKFSKTMGERYLASCCNYCGGFSGDFFLHDFLDELETQKDNKIFTGYYCPDCEHHFE